MSRRAFTLVELLVVIGIIAVLISILLPAINRARQHAIAVDCSSQLRQLGTALTIYAENNKGMYPTWSGWQVAPNSGTGDDSTLELAWTEQLEPYYVKADSSIYNCKAFPEQYRVNYFLAGRWTYLRDVAQGWTGTNRPLRGSDVRNASEFVMSGDCTQQSLYPPGFGTAPMTQDDYDKDDASQEAIVFRGGAGGLNMHRTGNNVLFGDGHVALFHDFDPAYMSYHPRTRGVDWASVVGD